MTEGVGAFFRPIVLNRKNALFAGHDQGAENWACIASLIETYKLNGVYPETYFTDVLTKLVACIRRLKDCASPNILEPESC